MAASFFFFGRHFLLLLLSGSPDPGSVPGRRAQRGGGQILATWVNDSSTGRLAAEDRDQHLELLRVGVDLVDGGRQRGERAVHDGDRLADREVDLGARPARPRPCWRPPAALRGAAGVRILTTSSMRQRGRPLRGRADEPGHARGVAHRAPGPVGQVHPDQDVAGVDLALDLLALAVLDLGDLLGRDLDLEDVVLHVQRLDPGLEVGLDLVLVAGVGVHDVPVAGRPLERGPQFLGGVSTSSTSAHGRLVRGVGVRRRRTRRRRLDLVVGLVGRPRSSSISAVSASTSARRRRRRIPTRWRAWSRRRPSERGRSAAPRQGIRRGSTRWCSLPGTSWCSSLSCLIADVGLDTAPVRHRTSIACPDCRRRARRQPKTASTPLANSTSRHADQRDHEHHEDDHHDGVGDHLVAGRPDDLAQLGDDLTEEPAEPGEHVRPLDGGGRRPACGVAAPFASDVPARAADRRAAARADPAEDGARGAQRGVSLPASSGCHQLAVGRPPPRPRAPGSARLVRRWCRAWLVAAVGVELVQRSPARSAASAGAAGSLVRRRSQRRARCPSSDTPS